MRIFKNAAKAAFPSQEPQDALRNTLIEARLDELWAASCRLAGLRDDIEALRLIAARRGRDGFIGRLRRRGERGREKAVLEMLGCGKAGRRQLEREIRRREAQLMEAITAPALRFAQPERARRAVDGNGQGAEFSGRNRLDARVGDEKHRSANPQSSERSPVGWRQAEEAGPAEPGEDALGRVLARRGGIDVVNGSEHEWATPLGRGALVFTSPAPDAADGRQRAPWLRPGANEAGLEEAPSPRDGLEYMSATERAFVTGRC